MLGYSYLRLALALPLVAVIGCSSSEDSSPAEQPKPSLDGSVPTDASDASDASTDVPPDLPIDASEEADALEQPDTQACEPPPILQIDEDFFVDISEESGIQDENFVENPPVSIPINDHSRLGFADINGDGFDDIVMHSLFPNPKAGIPFEHLVFVNQQDGTFTNVSDASGLRDIQAGFFAFADVDNDGDQDVFAGLDITDLPNMRHQLLLNDGKGVFTVLADSGLEKITQTVASNAVFGDFDGDGDLDLFIANGQTSYLALDLLWLNDGTGVFTNVTATHLKGNRAAPSNGAVACDYDNDGDLDLFVSVYGVSQGGAQNFLFENDGTGKFKDVAVERGFASLPTGNYWTESTGYGTEPEPGKGPGTYVGGNGFGIDCADVNHDGLMDILITNISHPSSTDASRKWSDPTQLLINQGAAAGWTFKNEFLERGLPFNEGDVDGALMDYDNDGRIDISISRDKKYESSYTEPDQKSWFGLMHQQPDGTFKSVGVKSGINDPQLEWLRMKGAQNHAWSDIDHDGDLDVLVGGRDTGGGRPNFLFKNIVGSQNRWLAIRMIGDGVKVNRDAIGARVTIQDDERVFLREVRATRGMYNSMDTRVLHFGLGILGCSYQIEARWPDGTTVSLDPQAVGMNRYVTLRYPDAIEIP